MKQDTSAALAGQLSRGVQRKWENPVVSIVSAWFPCYSTSSIGETKHGENGDATPTCNQRVEIRTAILTFHLSFHSHLICMPNLAYKFPELLNSWLPSFTVIILALIIVSSSKPISPNLSLIACYGNNLQYFPKAGAMQEAGKNPTQHHKTLSNSSTSSTSPTGRIRTWGVSEKKKQVQVFKPFTSE